MRDGAFNDLGTPRAPARTRTVMYSDSPSCRPFVRRSRALWVVLALFVVRLSAHAQSGLSARLDSTYNAGTDDYVVRVMGAPHLQLNDYTTLRPIWACRSNRPCTLRALRIVVVVTNMPVSQMASDETAARAYRVLNWAVAPSWKLKLRGATDSLGMVWRGAEIPFESRSVEDMTVTASSEVRDARTLAGVRTARSFTVAYTMSPPGSDPIAATLVPGAEGWLRMVQATHWRLTVGRGGKSPVPPN